jgi:uncharacterized lipoprotein YehR (DUF1307 family)
MKQVKNVIKMMVLLITLTILSACSVKLESKDRSLVGPTGIQLADRNGYCSDKVLNSFNELLLLNSKLDATNPDLLAQSDLIKVCVEFKDMMGSESCWAEDTGKTLYKVSYSKKVKAICEPAPAPAAVPLEAAPAATEEPVETETPASQN